MDGIHKLYCNIPSTIAASTSIVPGSYLSCRSGDIPAGISWTGNPAPPPWPANTTGIWTSQVTDTTYSNVGASATCGSSGQLSASCGDISVTVPTAINMGTTAVTLTANTLYRVTFTGNGSVVRCTSASVQDVGIGTYNGQQLTLGEGINKIWIVNGNRVSVSNNGTAQVQLNMTLSCNRDW